VQATTARRARRFRRGDRALAHLAQRAFAGDRMHDNSSLHRTAAGWNGNKEDQGCLESANTNKIRQGCAVRLIQA